MSAMTTKTCGWVMEPVYQSRNANTGSRGVVAFAHVPLIAPLDVLDKVGLSSYGLGFKPAT